MKPRSGVTPGPKLPKDMNGREWAAWISENGLQGTDAVKTFTPTWTGFSAAPVGDLNYFDFGSIAAIWTPGVMLGTSNATSMSITTVPQAIRPMLFADARIYVQDDNIVLNGFVSIAGSGSATFAIDSTSLVANRVKPDPAGFTASGLKGLPFGWFVVYVK